MATPRKKPVGKMPLIGSLHGASQRSPGNASYSGKNVSPASNPASPLNQLPQSPNETVRKPWRGRANPTYALMKNAELGMDDYVRMRIVEGAQLDFQDEDGRTPLMMAAMNGHIVVVVILLEAGANKELMDKDGSTALSLAALYGHLKVVRFLVEEKVNLEVANKDLMTPLMLASQHGHLEVVQVLVEAGANVDAQNKIGWTALHNAADHDREYVIEYLLNSRASTELKDDEGNTPLFFASEGNFILSVKRLVENNCNIHARNNDENTSLSVAAEGGCTEVIKFLIEHNADVNAKNKHGNTVLHFAAGEGHAIAAGVLVDAGSNMEAENENGANSLIVAVWNNHKPVAEVLIQKGASLLSKMSKGKRYAGFTPMHVACDRGYLDLANFLENKGGPELLIVKAENGVTPLYIAVSKLNDMTIWAGSQSILLLQISGKDMDVVETIAEAWEKNITGATKKISKSAQKQGGNPERWDKIENILLSFPDSFDQTIEPALSTCLRVLDQVLRLRYEKRNDDIRENKTALEREDETREVSGIQSVLHQVSKWLKQGFDIRFVQDTNSERITQVNDELMEILRGATSNQAELQNQINQLETDYKLWKNEMKNHRDAFIAAQQDLLKLMKESNENSALDNWETLLNELCSTSLQEKSSFHFPLKQEEFVYRYAFLYLASIAKLKSECFQRIWRAKFEQMLYSLVSVGQGTPYRVANSLLSGKSNPPPHISKLSTLSHLVATRGELTASSNEAPLNSDTSLATTTSNGVAHDLTSSRDSIDPQSVEDTPSQTSEPVLSASDHLQFEIQYATTLLPFQASDSLVAALTAGSESTQISKIECNMDLRRNLVKVGRLFDHRGMEAIKHVSELVGKYFAERFSLQLPLLEVDNFEPFAGLCCFLFLRFILANGEFVKEQLVGKSIGDQEHNETILNLVTASLMWQNESQAKTCMDVLMALPRISSVCSPSVNISSANLLLSSLLLRIENREIQEIGCLEDTPLVRKSLKELAAFLRKTKFHEDPSSNIAEALNLGWGLPTNNLLQIKFLLYSFWFVRNGDAPILNRASKSVQECMEWVAATLDANATEESDDIPLSLKQSLLEHIPRIQMLLELFIKHLANAMKDECKAAQILARKNRELLDVLGNMEYRVPRSSVSRLLLDIANNSSLEYALLMADRVPAHNYFPSVLGLLPRSGDMDKKLVEKGLQFQGFLRTHLTDTGNALLKAAESGNHVEVKKLLDAGTDPNVTDKNGWTPLLHAVYTGHANVVRNLIAGGADKEIVDKDGMNALMLGALMGKTEVVQALVEGKAKLDSINKDRMTALSIAAQHNHEDIVKILAKAGCDIDAANKNGWSPLLTAAETGSAKIVKCLLEVKANSNFTDRDGWTALHLASENGHSQIADLLLTAGVNKNVQTVDESTALVLATQQNLVDVVKVLADGGCEVDIPNKDGQTPLMIASINGNLKIIEILLNHNAIVKEKLLRGSRQDKYGYTALHLACERGKLEVAKLLCAKAGVELLFAEAENGITPLQLAMVEDRDMSMWCSFEVLSILDKLHHKKKDGPHIDLERVIDAWDVAHLQATTSMGQQDVRLSRWEKVEDKRTSWPAVVNHTTERVLASRLLVHDKIIEFRILSCQEAMQRIIRSMENRERSTRESGIEKILLESLEWTKQGYKGGGNRNVTSVISKNQPVESLMESLSGLVEDFDRWRADQRGNRGEFLNQSKEILDRLKQSYEEDNISDWGSELHQLEEALEKQLQIHQEQDKQREMISLQSQQYLEAISQEKAENFHQLWQTLFEYKLTCLKAAGQGSASRFVNRTKPAGSLTNVFAASVSSEDLSTLATTILKVLIPLDAGVREIPSAVTLANSSRKDYCKVGRLYDHHSRKEILLVSETFYDFISIRFRRQLPFLCAKDLIKIANLSTDHLLRYVLKNSRTLKEDFSNYNPGSPSHKSNLLKICAKSFHTPIDDAILKCSFSLTIFRSLDRSPILFSAHQFNYQSIVFISGTQDEFYMPQNTSFVKKSCVSLAEFIRYQEKKQIPFSLILNVKKAFQKKYSSHTDVQTPRKDELNTIMFDCILRGHPDEVPLMKSHGYKPYTESQLVDWLKNEVAADFQAEEIRKEALTVLLKEGLSIEKALAEMKVEDPEKREQKERIASKLHEAIQLAHAFKEAEEGGGVAVGSDNKDEWLTTARNALLALCDNYSPSFENALFTNELLLSSPSLLPQSIHEIINAFDDLL